MIKTLLDALKAQGERIQWESVLSEEIIAQYQYLHLPQTYCDFLYTFGNGGYGPGRLFSLTEEINEDWYEDVILFYPEVQPDTWEYLYHHCHAFFQGCLPIAGNERYFHGLLLHGRCAGQVVSVDMQDTHLLPRFSLSFEDWYMTFLKERLNGYDTTAYGIQLAGTETEILQALQKDPWHALCALRKFTNPDPSFFQDTLLQLEKTADADLQSYIVSTWYFLQKKNEARSLGRKILRMDVSNSRHLAAICQLLKIIAKSEDDPIEIYGDLFLPLLQYDAFTFPPYLRTCVETSLAYSIHSCLPYLYHEKEALRTFYKDIIATHPALYDAYVFAPSTSQDNHSWMHFQSDAFAYIVQKTINKKSGLTELMDMKEITALDVTMELPKTKTGGIDTGILTSVREVAYACKLKEFYANGHPEIQDLDYLQFCPHLKKIELSHTGLSDIRFLSRLSELEELDISYNHITTLAPLAYCSHLRILKIQGNPCSDLGKLTYLSQLQIELDAFQFHHAQKSVRQCMCYQVKHAAYPYGEQMLSCLQAWKLKPDGSISIDSYLQAASLQLPHISLANQDTLTLSFVLAQAQPPWYPYAVKRIGILGVIDKGTLFQDEQGHFYLEHTYRKHTLSQLLFQAVSVLDLVEQELHAYPDTLPAYDHRSFIKNHNEYPMEMAQWVVDHILFPCWNVRAKLPQERDAIMDTWEARFPHTKLPYDTWKLLQMMEQILDDPWYYKDNDETSYALRLGEEIIFYTEDKHTARFLFPEFLSFLNDLLTIQSLHYHFPSAIKTWLASAYVHFGKRLLLRIVYLLPASE